MLFGFLSVENFWMSKTSHYFSRVRIYAHAVDSAVVISVFVESAGAFFFEEWAVGAGGLECFCQVIAGLRDVFQ